MRNKKHLFTCTHCFLLSFCITGVEVFRSRSFKVYFADFEKSKSKFQSHNILLRNLKFFEVEVEVFRSRSQSLCKWVFGVAYRRNWRGIMKKMLNWLKNYNLVRVHSNNTNNMWQLGGGGGEGHQSIAYLVLLYVLF